jgi:hypothetical protein
MMPVIDLQATRILREAANLVEARRAAPRPQA